LRCCSGVPKATITSLTMLVTAMVTAVDAQPAAISVIARLYETTPASAPPSASGTFTPMSPSFASSSRSSFGTEPSSSIAFARGAMDERANARAVSRTIRCVSPSSKSISGSRR
jgi:hypothetical protein